MLAWKKCERHGVVVHGAGGGAGLVGGDAIRVGGRVPWGTEVEYALSCGLRQPWPGVGDACCSAGLFLHVERARAEWRLALVQWALGMEQEWARQQGRTPDTGVLPCTSMYATVLRFMRMARDLLRRQCLRSIPACAGEPRRHARLHGRGRVYPRVCGGTASQAAVPGHPRRSIPACAG